MNNDEISILCNTTYACYTASLIAANRGYPAKWEYMTDFNAGDMVMEISTIWWEDKHPIRIGYLISAEREWMHSDEEWSSPEVREEWDNERPREKRFRICLLKDGTEQVWTNARFVRVPMNLRSFDDAGVDPESQIVRRA